MSRVELHPVISGRSTIASPRDVREFTSALNELQQPGTITIPALERLSIDFRNWEIRCRRLGITVGEWIDELRAPCVSSDFRKRLTHLSIRTQTPAHRPALEPFTKGRFCEFRAAFAAESADGVARVVLARRNSELDVAGIDLLLSPLRIGPDTPIQVKAGSSREGKISGSIRSLCGVWKRYFSDLQSEIAGIIGPHQT